MTTADQIADDLLRFIVNRVNVTTGTREDIRRQIVQKFEPFAPKQQPVLDFDITAGKHGGNPQSIAAAIKGKGKHAQMRRTIYTYLLKLRDEGTPGATCWEISEATGILYNTCSGRCSELKADNMIRESGELRATGTGSAAAVLVTV